MVGLFDEWKEDTREGNGIPEVKINMLVEDVEDYICPKAWSKTPRCEEIRGPISPKELIVARKLYRNIYKATQLVNSIYGFPIVLLVFRTSVSMVSHFDNAIKLYNGSIKQISLRNENTSIESYIIALVFWIFLYAVLLANITMTTQVAKKKAGDIIDQVEEHLLHYPQKLKSFNSSSYFNIR
ncbi:hypothetical protein ANN_25619 [Periplaneta americana]|uniref:Gustatory receptor n=1 Tax=Periplaneta americana TaxID=6978 RepID=A0ABQ8S1P8_PERAM|nr:hypothetical protein ANN_25619 [Periplaneta americana]